MQRLETRHFFLTVVFLLLAVFLLDFFAPSDDVTGYSVYPERGKNTIHRPLATEFSKGALLERRDGRRAGFSFTNQIEQCAGKCGGEGCADGEVCLPVYTSTPSFGIPTKVRTCMCLPRPSDG